MIDRWIDSAKAQGNKTALFLACMQWYFLISIYFIDVLAKECFKGTSLS